MHSHLVKSMALTRVVSHLVVMGFVNVSMEGMVVFSINRVKGTGRMSPQWSQSVQMGLTPHQQPYSKERTTIQHGPGRQHTEYAVSTWHTAFWSRALTVYQLFGL